MTEVHDGNSKTSKTKKIASNTILLFVRMLFLTVINLVAVRLALKGLGQVDYGIFNTVAGVILMSSAISGVLSLSIQRFYSYSIGLGDGGELRKIFSASLNIVIALVVLILIVFETAGIWFVSTKLVIPPERMGATMAIFQITLLSFIFSILQIPFIAAIFAHEDMNAYAAISILEGTLRLVAVILIAYATIDRLVFYSLGLLLTSVVICAIYVVVASTHYPECHYEKCHDKGLYRHLLSFSGWTLFGSLAGTGIIQGNMILLNIFFGPILAAAFAIAIQIYNAFNSLCNSLVLAFRPAMIKSYAQQNYDYLDNLFAASNKSTLYILSAVAIPLEIEMPAILNLWLGNVSVDIILFARLIIVYIVCISMNNPITIIMQASGHIKEYHLPVESITLMSLPVSWVLFKAGLPSYSVFYSMIGVIVVAHGVRLFILHHFYPHFSVWSYITQLVLPGLFITAAALCLGLTLHHQMANGIVRVVSVFMLTPLAVVALFYFFGINSRERAFFKSMLHVERIKACRR